LTFHPGYTRWTVDLLTDDLLTLMREKCDANLVDVVAGVGVSPV
jgi:hypothetical protein